MFISIDDSKPIETNYNEEIDTFSVDFKFNGMKKLSIYDDNNKCTTEIDLNLNEQKSNFGEMVNLSIRNSNDGFHIMFSFKETGKVISMKTK